MKLHTSSLRLQLLLMSLTVVVFPMLLATAFSIMSQKEQIDRSLQREMNSSLGACRLFYDNLQERLEMMTLAVANDNTCKTTIRLGVLPQLQKQVSLLASKYGMDFLLMTDTAGKILARHPYVQQDDSSLSGHPLIQNALQGKVTTVAHHEIHPLLVTAPADATKKESQQVLFIESSIPIKIRETPVGTILSGIRLSGNKAMMLNMQKAADADKTVLLVEGNITAASYQPDFPNNPDNPLLQLIYPPGGQVNKESPDTPTTITCPMDGRRLAVKWYSIEGVNKQPLAALATLLDYDRAASLINAATLRILTVFFIGMVLAAIISFLVSRSIVSPVKSLSGAMQEVQEGKISKRIPVNRQDEIGILANGFNTMLGKLQAQFESLQKEVREREKAELSLAGEKERLAVTLRSIGDGVITTDIQGRVLFINTVAEQLTGWRNDEAQGKHSNEVFHIIDEKTGETCASPISRVLKLGRIVGLANHTALIAKDGSRRSIADSGAPIRNRESKIIGVVLVFRDVTLEKKMEEELINARKLESVGILAGGIAHDFNNILAAILGNIELAAYRTPDAESRALLTEAQKAIRRATKLTQQLLTFSKGGDPVKETASLPKIITESAEFVLHGSKVSCNYNFQDDLWLVNVDSGQIGQVIQNIILNAKHAMPQGGNINISCKNVQDAASESLLSIPEGKFVRIIIADSGIGIPQEILDNIFDPYFSTKNEGSGLGLAICYSIINKHKGNISVQSKPGKGTVFSIYLPADTSAEITAEHQPSMRHATKASRIILMDDEEMIRDLAVKQLTMLGHKTIPVVDGNQAVDKYQELQDQGTPADLVIMDLTIPGGMGGQKAARRLLDLDPAARIIVASGYSNDPVMSNYREYGFIAAVSKPFSLIELGNAIDAALD